MTVSHCSSRLAEWRDLLAKATARYPIDKPLRERVIRDCEHWIAVWERRLERAERREAA